MYLQVFIDQVKVYFNTKLFNIKPLYFFILNAHFLLLLGEIMQLLLQRLKLKDYGQQQTTI